MRGRQLFGSAGSTRTRPWQWPHIRPRTPQCDWLSGTSGTPLGSSSSSSSGGSRDGGGGGGDGGWDCVPPDRTGRVVLVVPSWYHLYLGALMGWNSLDAGGLLAGVLTSTDCQSRSKDDWEGGGWETPYNGGKRENDSIEITTTTYSYEIGICWMFWWTYSWSSRTCPLKFIHNLSYILK